MAQYIVTVCAPYWLSLMFMIERALSSSDVTAEGSDRVGLVMKQDARELSAYFSDSSSTDNVDTTCLVVVTSHGGVMERVGIVYSCCSLIISLVSRH